MSYKILFVFEGEKTEFNIAENIPKHFLNENPIIKTAYCNDVYELFKEIQADDFLETFALLKQIEFNSNILKDYSSSDFAEIYLFFDYDGHDNLADDKKLQLLLDFFSEETDKGKLYISYPMIESLKHFPKEGHFKDVVVPARENIKYKSLVNKLVDRKFHQLGSYTFDIWITLLGIHVKKLNYIVEGSYSVPTRYIAQLELFNNQLEKYILPNSEVSVVNSIPIFLIDYLGIKFIKKQLS